MKTLVVYYSWGNNTKTVAEYIAEKTGADILELKVKDNYPENYNACVAKVGKLGKKNEPELTTEIPDLSQYEAYFVGSPCWWGTIANPLRTFLHQNDLTGKTIFPFMTHGTSGMNIQDIPKLCPDSKIMRGLSIYNQYQVSTNINTPDNMEDYQRKTDEWLAGLGF